MDLESHRAVPSLSDIVFQVQDVTLSWFENAASCASLEMRGPFQQRTAT